MLVTRAVVEDRAVSDAVARLPADQRLISVSWVGTRTLQPAAIDRDARRALRALEIGEPVEAVAFRSIRLGTEVVRLAAFERPATVLAVTSGSLPDPCSSSSCELVALDAPGGALAGRFEVVGSVTARPEAPLLALVGSTSARERTLIASGIEGLVARPELSDLFRTFTWAVRLDPNALDSAQVASLPRRIAAANTELRNRSPGFDVRAPLQELTAAAEHSRRASRQQLLVGSQTAALFLAFGVLAASRLRRDARRTRYRLRRLGALRWQSSLQATAHAALIALPAVALGWLVGLATGSAIVAAADRPVADALERSAVSSAGFILPLSLGLIAVALIAATAGVRPVEIRGWRITSLDVAAAGTLATIGAILAAGQPDRQEEPSTLRLLLPVLIAFAGALITARILSAALRGAERLAPRRGVALRLALLSLVRNPGAAVVTVVCLAATIGMAVFAASYRTTLAANQRDTAAYAVPLDYLVARDEERAGSLASRTPLAPWFGTHDPVGVVRRGGRAPTLNRNQGLTVLGIPARRLSQLRWRHHYSEQTPSELGRAIAREATSLTGIAIPADAEELVFRQSLRGDPIRISGHVRRPDGGFSSVELLGGTRSRVLRARLGPEVRSGTLVALTLRFPPAVAFTAAHRATGSRPAPDVLLRGRITLGQPLVRIGTRLRLLAVDYREWVLADGARRNRSRTALRLGYLLAQGNELRVRPRQATDGQPISVIASSSLAAAAGGAEVLPIEVAGADIRVRIVATARRFPTLSGDFFIADRDALETAANADLPGSAIADEVWLRAPPGAEAGLRRRSDVPVRVASRAALEQQLRADPVSRAASIALVTGALLALATALAGVLLATSLDARDEAADLFDLEALGLAPRRLSQHLWLRSAMLIAAGLIGGLLTGVAATLVVTEVVTVTANATAAEPPLVPVLDWLLLSAGLVGFAMVGLGAVSLLARAAFRAPTPDRPEVV